MIERTKFLAAIDGTQIKHFRDAVCNVIEQIGAGRVSQINQSDEMLYSALRIVTRDLRMWSYWPQAALVRFEAWRKEFDAAVERAGLLDQGVFDQELEDFATLDDPAKRDEFRRAIEATADTALVKGCHRTAIADVLLETAVEIQMSKIGYGHLWFENAEEELKHCASMHEVAAGSLTKFLDKLDANPDDQTRS